MELDNELTLGPLLIKPTVLTVRYKYFNCSSTIFRYCQSVSIADEG